MKSTLLTFTKGVEALRNHVNTLQLEWQLISEKNIHLEDNSITSILHKIKENIGNGIDKRRFDYNSIIVSLYGLLEQLIEGLNRDYASQINSIVPDYKSWRW